MSKYTIKVIDNPECCEVGACGVHFAHSKATIEDDRAAAWFREHEGYEVIEEASKEKALSAMAVPELKKYAKENGIELGEAEKKADILATIELAAEE